MKLCVLVNDTPHGVMGLRARNLIAPLSAAHEVGIFYRESGKVEALRRFSQVLREQRPDLVYVMNVGYAGGGAVLLARAIRGTRFILDHGDPSYDLLKSNGRPAWESWLVRLAEWTMIRAASAVVARGAFLAETLRQQRPDRVFFIPDGVDTTRFKPLDVSAFRRQSGLDGALTIGVVGSLVWSDRYQMCYGWDILEALRLLKTHDVRGIIVGDGSGLPYLQQRAQEYGIADRVWFAGRVPHDDVPRYINLMDVCVSTQTNDAVGQSRTTAKLPEYLACGRFIIATDVGGARQVIHENGLLLPYTGVYDPAHPQRLAAQLEWLSQHRAALERGMLGVAIARQRFEYARLTAELKAVIEMVIGSQGSVMENTPHMDKYVF
ncbi:MAG: glycosyltransferase [Candidatus Latescibacteria bacterium]|nr:glycosyltransferase [Candidatus Latescibacterota bacterium]